MVLNNILYLEVPDLVNVFGVQEGAIKKGLYRARSTDGETWRSINHPSDKRVKLIDYRSIPTTTKSTYGIPSEEELRQMLEELKREEASVLLTRKVKQAENADDHAYYIMAGLKAREAKGYMSAAAWLRVLDAPKGKADVRALGLPGIETKEALLDLALVCIQADKPLGLHKVGSVQILRRKVADWRKAGGSRERELQCLVHKHRKLATLGLKGNQGHRKVTPAIEEAIVARYIGLHDDVKLNFEQLWIEYHSWVEQGYILLDAGTGEIIENPPALSVSSIKNVLYKADNTPLIRMFRDGSKAYRDAARPFVRRKAPAFSLSLVSCDGETSPFAMPPRKGSAAPIRPTAYLIFDTASQALIGKAIGLREDKQLMERAFYDMLITTGGLAPMEAQLDNFGKKYRDEMSQMIPVVSFAKPYNAQEKFVESIIGRFEQDVLRTIPGNVGQNITAKTIQSRRNPDKEAIYYTFEEIEAIYDEAQRRWNSLISKSRGKGKTRWENFQERLNPDAPRISAETMAMLFGHTTAVTIHRGWLSVQHQGEAHLYEVPHYLERLALMPKDMHVRVRLLPHDTSRAWIYRMPKPADPAQDEMICEVIAAQLPSAAKVEQTDADRYTLARLARKGKQMDEALKERADALPDLDYASAEAILALGYTQKANMAEAQAVLEAANDQHQHSTSINPRWKRNPGK